MSVTIKDIQVLVDEYADQAYVQGYEAAEARIIKLLETESRCKGTEHDYNGDCYCDTIALIKGENNG